MCESRQANMTSPLRNDIVSVTPFIIPPVFDSVLYNKPDTQSVLVHSYSSSFTSAGIQAIVCFFPLPILPAHLGLPLLDNYEDKVFVQVSAEDQPFLVYSHVPHGQTMQINVTEYLILLQFVAQEFPRLESKLKSQLMDMQEGTNPINITGHLIFYNHGSSYFKTNISSRLVFKAWIQSSLNQDKIYSYLEKKSEHTDKMEQLRLPMDSLLTLANDTTGIKVMTEILAHYKSRVKKKPRPVV